VADLSTLHVRELKTLPICDRCNRPVDRLIEVEDTTFDRLTFIAACHGDRERITITHEELVVMRGGSLQFGRAFVQVRALPPKT